MLSGELLGSLMKRNWPTWTCTNVPWASYTPRCNFHGWLSLSFVCDNKTSLPVTDMGQGERPASFDEDSKSALSKEEMDITEDGDHHLCFQLLLVLIMIN